MPFLNDLVVEEETRGRWRVTTPLLYRAHKGPKYRVPPGFVTDFASVPRVLWWILPPYGRHTKAAVLHDFLYQTQRVSRVKADALFREAMGSLKVAGARRVIMWAGVRVGGWLAWRNNRKRQDDLVKKGGG